MTPSSPSDPRPFITHMLLATKWLRVNAKRADASAIARTMEKLDAATLRKLLAAHGVSES